MSPRRCGPPRCTGRPEGRQPRRPRAGRRAATSVTETAILLAQMLKVGLLAAWLTPGLRDNMVHPVVNETFTAEVVPRARMRRDWPEMHARLAHRAVHSRRLQRLLFAAIVLGEAVVVLLLWSAAACLALAAAGSMDAAAERPVALAGAAAVPPSGDHSRSQATMSAAGPPTRARRRLISICS